MVEKQMAEVADVLERDGLTNLRLIADGHIHSRRFTRTFTDRTLSRLCREFIEDICA